MKCFEIADLFCGAGGSSTGAVEAVSLVGYKPSLLCVNHWKRALETSAANHPYARHLCTSIDDINPRNLYQPGKLDLLWASPECTHHSVARGGRPISDQSRATAWCVIRWADAVMPGTILVENVPEFADWGPVDVRTLRPILNRKGEIFQSWVSNLRSLGYRVEWRVLCAADYGDPTTRRRLFVQAVRGKRKCVWPDATHGRGENMKPWVAARSIIDWDLQGGSIYERKKPLSEKTLKRMHAALLKFGLKAFIVPQHGDQNARDIDRPAPVVTTTSRGVGLAEPFIIAWDHQSGSGAWSSDVPLSTVTGKARHGVVEPYLVELRGTSESQLLNSGRSMDSPLPTVTAGGGHLGIVDGYLVQVAHGNSKEKNANNIEYYGTGGAESLSEPLNTVTSRHRFGLVRPIVIISGKRYQLDIRFRMLQPRELARAQGFREDYIFTGNKTEQVKQIGNAVPRRLSRALVAAAVTQKPDVRWMDA